MKNNLIFIIPLTLLIIMGMILTVMVLVGGGKDYKKIFTDSDYPCEYALDGKDIEINLNGKKTADIKWGLEIEDEDYVNVEQKGSDKNGSATYIISPKKAGQTDVTFVKVAKAGDASFDMVTIKIPVFVSAGKKSLKAKVEGECIINDYGGDVGGKGTKYPYYLKNENGKNPRIIFTKGVNNWTVKAAKGNPQVSRMGVDESGFIYYEITQPAGKKKAIEGTLSVSDSEAKIKEYVKVVTDSKGNVYLSKGEKPKTESKK